MKYLGKYDNLAEDLHKSDKFHLIYNEHCIYFCKFCVDASYDFRYYVAYEKVYEKNTANVMIREHFNPEGHSTSPLADDDVWELTDSEAIRHIYSEIC